MNLTIIRATAWIKGILKKNLVIKVAEGIIVAIDESDNHPPDALDAAGMLIVPGYIDLQVNGGNTVFFTNDISEKALDQMYTDHLARGTTTLLPTLVSTSLDNILQAITVVKNYRNQGHTGVHGLHIEGPFISMERKGAHNPKHIRSPNDNELLTIIKAGEGVVKKITIAPELFSLRQIAMLREAGFIVSAGHSVITDEAVRPYFEAGINCVTHLYNAMSPFTGKAAGLTGATLDSEVYAGIIADGYHCSMTALRMAHHLKKGKLFLVSDATFIGNENLEMDGIAFIHGKGIYYNKEGNLAGSNIAMHDAVQMSALNAGIPLPEVLEMAAAIPARLLNMHNTHGCILPGYTADLNLLDPVSLALKTTIVQGTPVNNSLLPAYT